MKVVAEAYNERLFLGRQPAAHDRIRAERDLKQLVVLLQLYGKTQKLRVDNEGRREIE